MAKKAKAESDSTLDRVYQVIDVLDIKNHMAFVQKKFKMSGSTVDVEARKNTQVSTGMLMYDIVLGGGVFPGGWYTIFGGEGSAKSTSMMTMATAFQQSGVPYIDYRDAEGSSSPDYIESIAHAVIRGGKKFDIKNMFGVSNQKGEWVIAPRVWLNNDNGLEQFYKSVSAFLKRLPDKIYVDGEWWLFFDNTKENIARLKGKHDTKMGKRYGKLAVRSLDGGTAQALILLDSLPTLVSEADEEDDGNNSIGLNARGHSKHISKVRGKLKRKHVTLIAINQLRDSINLTGYGPKDYEPGGNAVRYAADVRMRHTQRAIPHGKGQIEEEASVEYPGGTDTYRYLTIKGHKNKYGTPYLEVWMRLWVSDSLGKGWGFDPVWDCWSYLKSTGQAEGSMGRKISIKIEDLELKGLTWLEFKGLILLTGDKLKALCTKLGLQKNPRIRDRCFKQLQTGDGMTRYFNTLYEMDMNDGEDEDAEEEELELEDWDDKDLIQEAIDLEIGDRKTVKKMSRKKLIAAIEEAWEAEEEDDDDEDEDDDE